MLRINHQITRVLVALIIFFIAFLFVVYAYTQPRIYFLYFIYLRTIIPFALFCVPFSFIGMVIWLRLPKDKPSVSYGVIVLGAIIFASVFACAATPLAVFNDYYHYSSVSLNEYQYHLDSEAKPGIGGNFRSVFLLWRCDSFNFNCDIVFNQRYDYTELPEVDYQNFNSSLTVDEDTNTLTLHINGEVAWTYVP